MKSACSGSDLSRVAPWPGHVMSQPPDMRSLTDAGKGGGGGGSTCAVLPCSFQADWSGDLDGRVKLLPVGGALPQGVGRRRVSDRQVVWPGTWAFGPALMSVSK